MFAAGVQRGVYDGLAVDQRAVLLEVGLFDGGQFAVIGAHVDGLVEQLRQAFGAVEKRLGTGDATRGRLGDIDCGA